MENTSIEIGHQYLQYGALGLCAILVVCQMLLFWKILNIITKFTESLVELRGEIRDRN